MLRLGLICLFLSACGSPVAMSDGSVRDDAGATDAGLLPDAGPADAGVSDAGPFDGGGIDAGEVDAGQPDAGLTADAGAGGPVGCVTSTTAGHHVFPCDGVTYEVEVSAACAAGGCGVVVDVHGLTMNGNAQDKSTKLRSIAPSLGYVVVQPTAPSSLVGPSWTPGRDDPKVWSFLQQLRQALRIDSKKIHMTGFSQGGAMTLRFLCAHADVLASVAPIAAADAQTLQGNTAPFVLDCPFTGTAMPSQQIPVLHMHGSVDGLVPIAKGRQQRDAALAAWSLGSPTVVSTSAAHTHTRYGSASGGLYEFLEHDYNASPPYVLVPINGHCVPGGDDVRANGAVGQTLFFSCAPPNAFIWGELVMQFFVAHPRP